MGLRCAAAVGGVLWWGAVAGVIGCGTNAEPPESCIPLVPTPIDSGGTVYQYVVNSIDFPRSATQAQQLGLDLDRDGNGRPDNALGQVLSSMASQAGIDLPAEIQALVQSGQIIHLVQVRTSSLDTADGVGVVIAHGVDLDGEPADNFGGDEDFGVEADPGTGRLSGGIEAGLATAEVGTVPLRLTFAEPGMFHARGARVEAHVTSEGMSGRIAGALSMDDVSGSLLPMIRVGIMRTVEEDCDTGVCAEGSSGELFLDLLDEDGDGTISIEELRSSQYMSSLLSPDVDLFDELGQLNPRCDGIKESLSIGFGFTAVPAVFPAQ